MTNIDHPAAPGSVLRRSTRGIHYLRCPAPAPATTIVLLHGIGSNAHSFAGVIDALPRSLDIIAWNAPGYSGSQPLAELRPSPADYAARLADLLDALDISRVVLIGHSLGALFAGSFAAHYPQRVSAIALLSPALGYCVGPNEPLPQNVQSRIDEVFDLGPTEFASRRAARLVSDPAQKPSVVDAVRESMSKIEPHTYAQAVFALGTGDLLSDIGKSSAPTLVAVGHDDVVTPPGNARAVFAKLSTPFEFHEIEQAGHALPQEQPRNVSKLLVRLVERAEIRLD